MEPAIESGTRPPLARGRRGRLTSAIAPTAVVASAAVAGLGLVWLLAPGLDPFGNGAMQSLASIAFGPTGVAVIALALGAAGVPLALLAARRGHAAHPAVTGVAAAVLATAVALTLGSMGIIAITGYLFGLAAVVAGVVTIAVMLVRAPRLGVSLLAGVVALIAASFWIAGLTLAGLGEFVARFSAALLEAGPNIAVDTVIVVTTLAWAGIAVTALRREPGWRRVEAWLVRHRRAITILAAVGPLPYAIARASWLTPWPLFSPITENLPPAMLATGLMLGAGAVAASVLTLGLILPWGRRFPAWMPRVGGRSVPVAVAVVPGSIAAGVLCISAAPMFVTVVGNPSAPVDALLVNLVLPLWFWGPMLALAVWAYAAWRREDARLD